MTSLEHLDPDCLEKVLELLQVKHVLLLVLCGSHRLNHRVFKLKKLCFVWSGSGFASWPSLISSFKQIEDFSLKNAPEIEFQPATRVNLESLSSSLTTLELCYYDPSRDLEQHLSCPLGTKFDFGTFLSGLKCLKIRSRVKISTSFVSELPTALLELKLVCAPIIGHISVINALPRTLTKLDIGTLDVGPATKEVKFPPNLTSLELQLEYFGQSLPMLSSQLPFGLLHLKITQTVTMAQLSLGPRASLKFEVDHSQKWWAGLPTSLQSLELELAELQNPIQSSLVWASMPLCVVNLYLRHITVSEDELSSVPNHCSELRLKHFPSEPSELHRICSSAPLTDDIPLSSYASSSLTSFVVDTGELNAVDAMFLPQSLKSLSVANITPDAYPIISKLRNLRHLSVTLGTVESSNIAFMNSISHLTLGYNSLKSLDAVESLKTVKYLKFVLRERRVFSSLLDDPEGFLRLPGNVTSLDLDCNIPQWSPNLKNTCLVVLKASNRAPLPLAKLVGCLPSTLEHLSIAYFCTSMKPSKFSKLPRSLKFLQLTNDTGIGMGTALRRIDPSIFQYFPPLYHLSLAKVWRPEGGWEAIRVVLPKSLIVFEIDLIQPDWFTPYLG